MFAGDCLLVGGCCQWYSLFCVRTHVCVLDSYVFSRASFICKHTPDDSIGLLIVSVCCSANMVYLHNRVGCGVQESKVHSSCISLSGCSQVLIEYKGMLCLCVSQCV